MVENIIINNTLAILFVSAVWRQTTMMANRQSEKKKKNTKKKGKYDEIKERVMCHALYVRLHAD